jgi:hypothetical protein
MIHYFVPLPLNRSIHSRVIPALKSQTEPVEIHECRTPGEDRAQNGKTALALKGERTSRILCVSEAAKLNPAPSFVIMADGDRACVDSNDDYREMKTNVEDSILFLEKNEKFGGISLVYSSKGHTEDDKNDHIDIGWAMYRYSIFSKLKFDLIKGERDYCKTVTRQIRVMGFRFGYLDEKHRIMHC